MRILHALFPALLLAACQKQDVRLKVLIGETAIVAPDSQPIQDAIIVIAGQKVRSVGMRKDIPVPQNSDRTDLTGELQMALQLTAQESFEDLVRDLHGRGPPRMPLPGA